MKSRPQVRLEYGGADVTQAFHWLLKKSAFPYKEFDEKLPQDAILMKNLKEEFCHVDLVRLFLCCSLGLESESKLLWRSIVSRTFAALKRNSSKSSSATK